MSIDNTNKLNFLGWSYIPYPKNKFKYVLFHVEYEDKTQRYLADWFNDKIKTQEGVKALTVLTAWIIRFYKGFGIDINVDKDKTITIHYKNKFTGVINSDIIPYEKQPKYLKQAVDIIHQELSARIHEIDIQV